MKIRSTPEQAAAYKGTLIRSFPHIFRCTCVVVFGYQDIECSERFRSREDAEMWAQKLREGHWDPLG